MSITTSEARDDDLPETDHEFIRAVVEDADLNVLRMALYQATRDESLINMTVERKTVRGGATVQAVLADEHHDEVKAKAIAYLEGPRDVVDEPLSPQEIKHLMEIFTGDSLTDREFAYRSNFLSLEDYQFGAEWTDGRPEIPEGFQAVIIGAGFSGIAIGVQFERLGIPYVIYERRGEVGGTWSINTYPDARVDTSSFTYQFTFEKRYPWSEFYARQAEVRKYLEHVARRLGVYEKIVFNAELRDAEYDDDSATWKLVVHHADGDRIEDVQANILVSGAGLFSVAKGLEVPGVQDFEGRIVHTTEWPPPEGVAGKRVAVVGNGSTGVQLLKRIAAEAGEVYVFQRTPQWIAPREGYGAPIPESLAWLLAEMPFYWNWYCYLMFSIPVRTQELHEYDREWQKAGGMVSKRNDGLRESLTAYIKRSVDNRPELYEHLIPKHPPMARRLIVDNGWYETLLRPNVELVPRGVERLTPTGIVDSEGTEREVDVIVTATGFQVTKYLWPVRYAGRNGVELDSVWDTGTGPMAYLGLTIPEFPNLFVMYGPNSQARTGSLPSWIEIWSRYVALAVVGLIESGKKSITVKREAFERYNAELDEACLELVWDDPTSRGRNYWVHSSGRQQVNAPWNVDYYYERLSAPDFADYTLE